MLMKSLWRRQQEESVMKKSGKRGFLIIEAFLEVMAVSLIMTAAVTSLAEAFRFSEQTRRRAGQIFIFQDTMEKIKYRSIYKKSDPEIMKSIILNGETYTIEIKEENCLIRDIPIKKINCAVIDSMGYKIQGTTAVPGDRA